MIPETLKEIENDLRKAVTLRRFEDVPSRLDDLRGMADKCIASLPESDPLRRELLGWVIEAVEWAHLMTVTQRQIWSGQLTRLPGIGRYLDRTDSRLPDVCLDL
jgi:hypothetical protein